MNWRELIVSVAGELEAILRDDRSARIAAIVGLGVLLATALATVAMARWRARRRTALAGAVPGIEEYRPLDPRDLGDWGLPRRNAVVSPIRSPSPDIDWPIDNVLPRNMAGTVGLALVIGAAVWLAGLAVTPDIPAFLASPEWQFQPLYLAVHIVAIRLFVRTYSRGFERGVSHLAVPHAQIRPMVGGVLGLPGALVALAAALPFAALDFLYLFSDDYARVGNSNPVQPIDYLMWSIWSIEWFLNALIWVIVVGFLIKTWRVVTRHSFRAPIEIVLHERHYRPFLQMSAQGASIVFGFTIATVLYIWRTGGEATDYAGLGITAIMLIVGFLPSFLLLKSKVRRAVDTETLTMRKQLLHNLELAEAGGTFGAIDGPETPGPVARSLEHRLDAAVAIMRISYLEGRHRDMGQAEARAVLLRILAPAASIGWQAAKSHASVLTDLQVYLTRLL